MRDLIKGKSLYSTGAEQLEARLLNLDLLHSHQILVI